MKMNNQMIQPLNVLVEIKNANWYCFITPDFLNGRKLIKKELDVNIVKKRVYV
jgi:hypothetical protein